MSNTMPCAFSLRPALRASAMPCSVRSDVAPAGEQVFQVPFALAVAHEHEEPARSFLQIVLQTQARRPSNKVPASCPRAHSAALSAPRAKIMRSSALCASSMPLGGTGEDHAVLADHRCRRATWQSRYRRPGARRYGRRARATERLSRSMPRPSAAARPSSSAVPEGASIFWLWCISRISMSNSASSVFATRLTSAASRLTPRLMLPDLTMTARLRGLRDRLLVPGRETGRADDMDDAGLRRRVRRKSTVAAGMVKSINAVGRRRTAAPASTVTGMSIVAEAGKLARSRGRSAASRTPRAAPARTSALASP